MPASIGVNLRVTGNCRQGGRKYMEDCFSVAYQQTEDEKDLEYAFFGIYDGHGGVEAASFAKEHLMETIIKHKNFWSDNDEDVLRAIKDGYIATHYAMWREQSKWPRTSSGLPSTAGTTASVAFIRRGKIYMGHVGDSGIILGFQDPAGSDWKAMPLTTDHKPENPKEMKRIEGCGGKVVAKSGVPRVVWNRPKIGHQGPVRRSTPIDEIPFLAVARSLGDLWSYNSQIDQFVVSPDPDCSVMPIDTNIHRCLIFGTDGLFNMLSPSMAVHIVQQAERHNESEALSDDFNKVWLNPSKLLVERALDRWHATKMRADNTSAVTLMLDPPGPPRAQVLKDRKKNLPESGLKIMTRYDQNASQEPPGDQGNSSGTQTTEVKESASVEEPAKTDLSSHNPEEAPPEPTVVEKETVEDKTSKSSEDTTCTTANSSSNTSSISSSDVSSNYPLKERNFVPKLRESTSFDPREPYRPSDVGKENNTRKSEDNTIQINEISSSNIDESVLEEDGRADASEIESGKCTLRSSKRQTKQTEQQEKKASKRKTDSENGHPQPRKSLRLSLTQKFLQEGRGPAPCTLAEEKLKKLAEEAEKLRTLTTEKNNNVTKEDSVTRKLSITQKILKSKKVSLKKKSLVKSQLNRKSLKMVLETVIAKTGKKKAAPRVVENPLKLLERSLRNPEKRGQEKQPQKASAKPVKVPESIAKQNVTEESSASAKQIIIEKHDKIKAKVAKNKQVVLAGKLSHFKRQSMRTASLRPKKTQSSNSLCNEPTPQSPNKLVKRPAEAKTAKEAAKSDVKTTDKKAASSPRKAKLQVLNSIRETRSSPLANTSSTLRSSTRGSGVVGQRNDAKENIKEVNPKAVKHGSLRQKKSPKPLIGTKNTLRQRLQDKTKSLKKTVLKRSR